MKLMRILICNAFTGLIFFYSTISNAATFIYFRSEPGDYIGQGSEQTLTTDDGVFTATSSPLNVVAINFNGSTWWNLSFAAPQGQQLQPGPYEGATRYPFQSPTGPGLDVSGDGRGCNTLTGRFDVLEAVYESGQIKRFAADFEQHCEGFKPALFGSVRYNATVGFPPKMSITANGSSNPIIINAGETVEIKISMEAGDKRGVMAERWLGVLRPSINLWNNGNRWTPSVVPLKWDTKPFTTFEKVIDWGFHKPGVYLFMFAADEKLDGKLDTQYVDHVVVTVKQPPNNQQSEELIR